MASGIYYPAVIADNGIWYPPNGFTTTENSVYFGDLGGGFVVGVFARFVNVTIPQGATITSAVIKWTSDTVDSVDDVLNNIYFNNIDDAIVPTSYGEAEALDLTDAVAWDNLESWDWGVQYDTSELKTILQTVVDRGSWSSGNALMALVKDDGSSSTAHRAAYSYKGDSGSKAELHVEWETGGDVTITLPSPFVATAVLLATPVDVISIIGTKRVYLFTLTGAPDGEDDIVIPIKSFQSRLKSVTQGAPTRRVSTYLSVVIPTTEYSAAINLRLNGDLIIKMGYKSGSDVLISNIIAQVSFDSISIDEGPTNKSVTLSGYATVTETTKEIDLENATYTSTDDAKLSYRCSPNIYLRPGDTVNVEDDTFIVDNLIYSVAVNQETFQVSE